MGFWGRLPRGNTQKSNLPPVGALKIGERTGDAEKKKEKQGGAPVEWPGEVRLSLGTRSK